MRVLFINRMAGMIRGGGETFDLEISRFMEKQGVEVSYLTGAPLMGAQQNPLHHPRAYTVRSPYSGHLDCYHFPAGWRMRALDIQLFERQALRWVKQHIDSFDVVQVCELTRFVLAFKKHWPDKVCVLRMPGPQRYGPEQALRSCDALIASGATVEHYRNEIRSDIEDLPNGVDIDLFCPGKSPFRARFGIPEDALVSTFVARFQPVKNHAMLLEAFAIVCAEQKHHFLVLTGEGPQKKRCMDLIKKRSLAERVIFTGELPFTEVANVYRAADLKVISSDYESFSFVALEAMASGLPLLATQTEWIPRLMDRDAGGAVVPVNDPQRFAHAWLSLTQDVSRMNKAGKRNRDFVVEHHSWAHQASRLRAIYEHLLATPRNR